VNPFTGICFRVADHTVQRLSSQSDAVKPGTEPRRPAAARNGNPFRRLQQLLQVVILVLDLSQMTFSSPFRCRQSDALIFVLPTQLGLEIALLFSPADVLFIVLAT